MGRMATLTKKVLISEDFVLKYFSSLKMRRRRTRAEGARGPKAQKDLSGVNPTFEVFNRLKHDQGAFVKEIPRDIFI